MDFLLAPFSHDGGQMISHWLVSLFYEIVAALIGGNVGHVFNASQLGEMLRKRFRKTELDWKLDTRRSV